jgi:hypothetical protein
MGWNIIRGNHARQPRSSSPKSHPIILFSILLFFSQIVQSIYFWYFKAVIYPPIGDSQNIALNDDTSRVIFRDNTTCFLPRVAFVDYRI